MSVSSPNLRKLLGILTDIAEPILAVVVVDYRVEQKKSLYILLIVQFIKGMQLVQFSCNSVVVATCSHRLPFFETGFYFLKSIKRNTKR